MYIGKTKRFLTVLNYLLILILILFVSVNVSKAQENQQEYCIQNKHTKGFLSEKTNILTANCEVEEKWNMLKQDDGSYCIRNLNTAMFSSDRLTELWPRCSTGEKWNLTPVFAHELNTTEYCIENVYLATQQKKYLSNRPTEFWPRCSKRKK